MGRNKPQARRWGIEWGDCIIAGAVQERAPRRAARPHVFPSREVAYRPQLHTDRKSLLLSTALASTLLIGTLAIPAPARAVVNNCADPGPDAVLIKSAAPIIGINTEVRNDFYPVRLLQ
jgi:hypothetical protein